MKKLIVIFLFLTSIAHSAMIINDVIIDTRDPESGRSYTYDITSTFESENYVEGWTSTNNLTYYDSVILSVTEDGTYTFTNYSSNLQGINGSTFDTQLLFYEIPPMPTNVILDRPTAFLNTYSDGFGLSWIALSPDPTTVITEIGSDQETPAIVDLTTGEIIQNPGDPLVDISEDTSFVAGAFGGSIVMSANQQYLMVTSSFADGGLGSVDFTAKGPGRLSITAVPEPSSYALLFGWIAFLYVAIGRRNA